MANYEQYLTNGQYTPGWLQGANSSKYLAAHGATLDEYVSRIKIGVKAAFPTQAGAAGDDLALYYLGQEMGLPRGPSETDSQYGDRLRIAWDIWPWAGTALGILLILETQDYTATNGNPILIQQARYAFTLAAATTPPQEPQDRLVKTTLGTWRGEPGWRFDDNSALPPSQGMWSRFGLLWYTPPAAWTGIVAPPTTATAPTLNEVNNIIRLVNAWRPAKATWARHWVRTSGLLWGWPPSQNWGGAGFFWGGATTVDWQRTEY